MRSLCGKGGRARASGRIAAVLCLLMVFVAIPSIAFAAPAVTVNPVSGAPGINDVAVVSITATDAGLPDGVKSIRYAWDGGAHCWSPARPRRLPATRRRRGSPPTRPTRWRTRLWTAQVLRPDPDGHLLHQRHHRAGHLRRRGPVLHEFRAHLADRNRHQGRRLRRPSSARAWLPPTTRSTAAPPAAARACWCPTTATTTVTSGRPMPRRTRKTPPRWSSSSTTPSPRTRPPTPSASTYDGSATINLRPPTAGGSGVDRDLLQARRCRISPRARS